MRKDYSIDDQSRILAKLVICHIPLMIIVVPISVTLEQSWSSWNIFPFVFVLCLAPAAYRKASEYETWRRQVFERILRFAGNWRR
jgi:hypothetical protein